MCEVDINNDLLLGFTALWVDSKFQRRSSVLQPQELSERHTDEYIPLKITKMLIDWNIIYATEHSCCHQRQWINIREANLPSYGCFTHSLQLVVND